MNRKIDTKDIVLSGLLLAAGLILPMIFHTFSMTGPIFLPMHIPVLIGGMLLPPPMALLLGIITPILSSILTGMPVAFPMAIIMTFELGSYGLLASLAMRKLKTNIILSLIIAMVGGRIAAGIAVALIVALFGVQINPVLYVKGAIITGIPGLLIQLVFIPTLIYGLKTFTNINLGTN